MLEMLRRMIRLEMLRRRPNRLEVFRVRKMIRMMILMAAGKLPTTFSRRSLSLIIWRRSHARHARHARQYVQTQYTKYLN